MQAMGAALPELDGVEFHAESAPETRQRHLALLELLLQLEEFAFQHAAREMRDDCCDTQAPIWLSFGRLLKYFSTSRVDRRSTWPRKITWRSSMCQGTAG